MPSRAIDFGYNGQAERDGSGFETALHAPCKARLKAF